MSDRDVALEFLRHLQRKHLVYQVDAALPGKQMGALIAAEPERLKPYAEALSAAYPGTTAQQLIDEQIATMTSTAALAPFEDPGAYEILRRLTERCDAFLNSIPLPHETPVFGVMPAGSL